MHIDHITIRTRNLVATRDFFLTVFDLEEQEHPKAIQRTPSHWLCSEGKPVILLIGSRGHGLDGAPEAFDHVGLRLTGYGEFRAKPERLGIHYSLMDLPELNERRLFFRTPSGPLLEAVFTEPMPKEAQVRALGLQHVDHIAIFNDMRHWDTAVELIRPQGGIVTIDGPDLPMPMAGMKRKAASLH